MVEEIFKTKDGAEVKIVNNGTHFIAYDNENKAVSKPWIKIESLKDEIGIAYDKPKTKESEAEEKAARKIEEPEPSVLEIQGKLEDGSKIKCVKKSTHWYAYDEDGRPVGQPWIKLNDLCEDIGLKTELQFGRTAAADEGRPEHNHNDSPLGNPPVTDNAESEDEITGKDSDENAEEETPEQAHEAVKEKLRKVKSPSIPLC